MISLLFTPFAGYGLTLLSVVMFGDWWDTGDKMVFTEYIIICCVYFTIMALRLLNKNKQEDN